MWTLAILFILFLLYEKILCVDPNVIMYLDFETVVNGTVKDKSGTNHYCTFENGATTADVGGKYGTAARFGIARDGGRLNCGQNIAMTTYGGYVSLWAKLLTETPEWDNRLVSKSTTNGGPGAHLELVYEWVGGKRIRWRPHLSQNFEFYYNFIPTQNEWVHIVVGFTNITTVLFLDGQQHAFSARNYLGASVDHGNGGQNLASPFVPHPELDLAIGNQPRMSRPDNRPFRGLIDEVLLLRNDRPNQALSSALATQLMIAPASVGMPKTTLTTPSPTFMSTIATTSSIQAFKISNTETLSVNVLRTTLAARSAPRSSTARSTDTISTSGATQNTMLATENIPSYVWALIAAGSVLCCAVTSVIVCSLQRAKKTQLAAGPTDQTRPAASPDQVFTYVCRNNDVHEDRVVKAQYTQWPRNDSHGPPQQYVSLHDLNPQYSSWRDASLIATPHYVNVPD